MAAGESARQQRDRHRARARRLEQEAAELQRQAADADQWADHWEAGGVGEEAVARVLDGLRQHEWVALHDRRRTQGSLANIDHIAAGPAGVVVVDAKNWSGRLAVGPDGVLRQNGYHRADEVAAVAADADRIQTELLGLVPVRSALCFTGTPLPQSPVVTATGTTLLNLADLERWLLSLPSVGASPLPLAGELNLLHPRRSDPTPPRRQRPLPRQVKPSRPTGRRQPAPVVRRTSAAGFRSGLLRLLLVVVVFAVVLANLPRIANVVSQHVVASFARTAAVQSGLTGSDLARFCASVTSASGQTPWQLVATPSTTAGTCTVRTSTGATGFVHEGSSSGSYLGATTSSGTVVHALCGTAWYEAAYQATKGTAVTWPGESSGTAAVACVTGTDPQPALQLVHDARHALR